MLWHLAFYGLLCHNSVLYKDILVSVKQVSMGNRDSIAVSGAHCLDSLALNCNPTNITSLLQCIWEPHLFVNQTLSTELTGLDGHVSYTNSLFPHSQR